MSDHRSALYRSRTNHYMPSSSLSKPPLAYSSRYDYGGTRSGLGSMPTPSSRPLSMYNPSTSSSFGSSASSSAGGRMYSMLSTDRLDTMSNRPLARQKSFSDMKVFSSNYANNQTNYSSNYSDDYESPINPTLQRLKETSIYRRSDLVTDSSQAPSLSRSTSNYRVADINTRPSSSMSMSNTSSADQQNNQQSASMIKRDILMGSIGSRASTPSRDVSSSAGHHMRSSHATNSGHSGHRSSGYTPRSTYSASNDYYRIRLRDRPLLSAIYTNLKRRESRVIRNRDQSVSRDVSNVSRDVSSRERRSRSEKSFDSDSGQRSQSVSRTGSVNSNEDEARDKVTISRYRTIKFRENNIGSSILARKSSVSWDLPPISSPKNISPRSTVSSNTTLSSLSPTNLDEDDELIIASRTESVECPVHVVDDVKSVVDVHDVDTSVSTTLDTRMEVDAGHVEVKDEVKELDLKDVPSTTEPVATDGGQLGPVPIKDSDKIVTKKKKKKVLTIKSQTSIESTDGSSDQSLSSPTTKVVKIKKKSLLSPTSPIVPTTITELSEPRMKLEPEARNETSTKDVKDSEIRSVDKDVNHVNETGLRVNNKNDGTIKMKDGSLIIQKPDPSKSVTSTTGLTLSRATGSDERQEFDPQIEVKRAADADEEMLKSKKLVENPSPIKNDHQKLITGEFNKSSSLSMSQSSSASTSLSVKSTSSSSSSSVKSSASPSANIVPAAKSKSINVKSKDENFVPKIEPQSSSSLSSDLINDVKMCSSRETEKDVQRKDVLQGKDGLKREPEKSGSGKLISPSFASPKTLSCTSLSAASSPSSDPKLHENSFVGNKPAVTNTFPSQVKDEKEKKVAVLTPSPSPTIHPVTSLPPALAPLEQSPTVPQANVFPVRGVKGKDEQGLGAKLVKNEEKEEEKNHSLAQHSIVKEQKMEDETSSAAPKDGEKKNDEEKEKEEDEKKKEKKKRREIEEGIPRTSKRWEEEEDLQQEQKRGEKEELLRKVRRKSGTITQVKSPFIPSSNDGSSDITLLTSLSPGSPSTASKCDTDENERKEGSAKEGEKEEKVNHVVKKKMKQKSEKQNVENINSSSSLKATNVLVTTDINGGKDGSKPAEAVDVTAINSALTRKGDEPTNKITIDTSLKEMSKPITVVPPLACKLDMNQSKTAPSAPLHKPSLNLSTAINTSKAAASAPSSPGQSLMSPAEPSSPVATSVNKSPLTPPISPLVPKVTRHRLTRIDPVQSSAETPPKPPSILKKLPPDLKIINESIKDSGALPSSPLPVGQSTNRIRTTFDMKTNRPPSLEELKNKNRRNSTSAPVSPSTPSSGSPTTVANKTQSVPSTPGPSTTSSTGSSTMATTATTKLSTCTGTTTSGTSLTGKSSSTTQKFFPSSTSTSPSSSVTKNSSTFVASPSLPPSTTPTVPTALAKEEVDGKLMNGNGANLVSKNDISVQKAEKVIPDGKSTSHSTSSHLLLPLLKEGEETNSLSSSKNILLESSSLPRNIQNKKENEKVKEEEAVQVNDELNKVKDGSEDKNVTSKTCSKSENGKNTKKKKDVMFVQEKEVEEGNKMRMSPTKVGPEVKQEEVKVLKVKDEQQNEAESGTTTTSSSASTSSSSSSTSSSVENEKRGKMKKKKDEGLKVKDDDPKGLKDGDGTTGKVTETVSNLSVHGKEMERVKNEKTPKFVEQKMEDMKKKKMDPNEVEMMNDTKKKEEQQVNPILQGKSLKEAVNSLNDEEKGIVNHENLSKKTNLLQPFKVGTSSNTSSSLNRETENETQNVMKGVEGINQRKSSQELKCVSNVVPNKMVTSKSSPLNTSNEVGKDGAVKALEQLEPVQSRGTNGGDKKLVTQKEDGNKFLDSSKNSKSVTNPVVPVINTSTTTTTGTVGVVVPVQRDPEGCPATQTVPIMSKTCSLGTVGGEKKEVKSILKNKIFAAENLAPKLSSTSTTSTPTVPTSQPISSTQLTTKTEAVKLVPTTTASPSSASVGAIGCPKETISNFVVTKVQEPVPIIFKVPPTKTSSKTSLAMDVKPVTTAVTGLGKSDASDGSNKKLAKSVAIDNKKNNLTTPTQTKLLATMSSPSSAAADSKECSAATAAVVVVEVPPTEVVTFVTVTLKNKKKKKESPSNDGSESISSAAPSNGVKDGSAPIDPTPTAATTSDVPITATIPEVPPLATETSTKVVVKKKKKIVKKKSSSSDLSSSDSVSNVDGSNNCSTTTGAIDVAAKKKAPTIKEDISHQGLSTKDQGLQTPTAPLGHEPLNNGSCTTQSTVLIESSVKLVPSPPTINPLNGTATVQPSRTRKREIDSLPRTVDDGNNTNGTKERIVVKRIRFRKYCLEDFHLLNVLGRGSFGKVFLAELKDHDTYFAIKCMKKHSVIEDDDVESTMIERRVLALGYVHPFICKLFCTFQTKSYLCFVMEYLCGGDLMFHVQKFGRMPEDRARFYASEVVCALKFLHKRAIIYRDLKLDNIVLDSDGHIRLVDFGMCQCKIYREECLPSNFCGTPEYMAPEIIRGVKYNHLVDWWSFGVLMYEMVVGKCPFTGSDEDELLWNVCHEKVLYPKYLSTECKSLIQTLLIKDPESRLGSNSCPAGDVCYQPYFNGVNWDAVEKKKLIPPHKPEVANPRDISNFDKEFTEAAPQLTPVKEDIDANIDHELFKGFSYTNPNMTD